MLAGAAFTYGGREVLQGFIPELGIPFEETVHTVLVAAIMLVLLPDKYARPMALGSMVVAFGEVAEEAGVYDMIPVVQSPTA
ncbi:hypothetical protein DVK00_02855 [Haloarcula sp. Atlit-47R]|nr:hypothetical protein DVK00_02855 [Haloarcula sp. Atlit-47R]